MLWKTHTPPKTEKPSKTVRRNLLKMTVETRSSSSLISVKNPDPPCGREAAVTDCHQHLYIFVVSKQVHWWGRWLSG